MRNSFDNLDWELSSLRILNVHHLMEVSFNSSGESIETVSCTSDGHGWNIVIHLGLSSLVVVGSVISCKTTSHENLTSEFGWVALDVGLGEDGTKRVSRDVKLVVGVETLNLELVNSCINCESELWWTWSIINVEMRNSDPCFNSLIGSLSLELLC